MQLLVHRNISLFHTNSIRRLKLREPPNSFDNVFLETFCSCVVVHTLQLWWFYTFRTFQTNFMYIWDYFVRINSGLILMNIQARFSKLRVSVLLAWTRQIKLLVLQISFITQVQFIQHLHKNMQCYLLNKFIQNQYYTFLLFNCHTFKSSLKYYCLFVT